MIYVMSALLILIVIVVFAVTPETLKMIYIAMAVNIVGGVLYQAFTHYTICLLETRRHACDNLGWHFVEHYWKMFCIIFGDITG